MRLTSTAALVIVIALALAATEGAAPPARAQQERNFVQAMNCVNDVLPGVGPVSGVAASYWIPRRADLPSGTQQVWIDLSLFNNNFARGTFIGAGAFLPEDVTQQFDWFNLVPARRHYYRLNALTPAGWIEVGRGEFDTPDCRNVGNFYCETSGRLRVVFLFDDAPVVTNGGTHTPQAQWIDLSLFNNNFAPGTFIGAGPFPPRFEGPFRASFEWEGIIPQRVHYYRFNTQYSGNLWAEHVGRGSFSSLDCRGLPSPAPASLT